MNLTVISQSVGELVFLVSYYDPARPEAIKGPTFIIKHFSGLLGHWMPVSPARIIPDWIYRYRRWSVEERMDAVREVAMWARKPENLIVAKYLKQWALETSVGHL